MASGRKTGGRQKGVPNRATAAKVAEVESSGLTPLDYLLSVLRNEGNDQSTRMDAAYKAAPFIHPKLAAIDVGNRDDKPFEQVMRWALSPSEATPDPSKL